MQQPISLPPPPSFPVPSPLPCRPIVVLGGLLSPPPQLVPAAAPLLGVARVSLGQRLSSLMLPYKRVLDDVKLVTFLPCSRPPPLPPCPAPRCPISISISSPSGATSLSERGRDLEILGERPFDTRDIHHTSLLRHLTRYIHLPCSYSLASVPCFPPAAPLPKIDQSSPLPCCIHPRPRLLSFHPLDMVSISP